MDSLTQSGAPTNLISDRAQLGISKKMLEILCSLFQMGKARRMINIKPAERRWRAVKHKANIYDRTGSLSYTWH